MVMVIETGRGEQIGIGTRIRTGTRIGIGIGAGGRIRRGIASLTSAAGGTAGAAAAAAETGGTAASTPAGAEAGRQRRGTAKAASGTGANVVLARLYVRDSYVAVVWSLSFSCVAKCCELAHCKCCGV
jgi:hypothetical protein